MRSNLPPGCSEGDIPGNRPEDAEWEAVLEWATDQLIDSELDAQEARRAVLIGIAAVKAERDEITSLIKECRADERMMPSTMGDEAD